MKMRTLFFLLALIAMPACGDDSHDADLGVADLGTDANPASCPANAPVASPCTTPDAVCSYPGQRCTCKGGSGLFWYCVDPACPTSATDGQSCTTANLSCTFGFEHGCSCVAPENKWACCGGVACPQSAYKPTEGTPCCNNPEIACSFTGGDGGVSCRCIDDHWKCE